MKRDYGAFGRGDQKVRDNLNTLLNEGADAICNADRYQQSPNRQVRHISPSQWGTRQYLNTCKLYKTV